MKMPELNQPFNILHFLGKDDLRKVAGQIGLSDNHTKVLVCLFEHLSDNGVTYSSQADLAVLCFLSRSQCKRALAKFREEGLIKTTRRGRSTTKIEFLYHSEFDKVCNIGKEEERATVPKGTSGISYVISLFKKIQGAYHPEKAFWQEESAKKAFVDACSLACRPFKDTTARKMAVDKTYDKVISYISYLKTTPTWTDDGGKYLLGLGNLLSSGRWKNKVPQYTHREATEVDKLKSILRG